MFRAGQFLEELGNHRPDILSACSRAMADARFGCWTLSVLIGSFF
ncbi:MAG: hypothetical protein R3E57_02555 [Porticoccaceae bacterium]